MDEQSSGMSGFDMGNFDLKAWMKWSLIPACTIVILFCFLEKRVHLWPTTCNGRPGVAFPVNLVDSYTNRWAFAFAFGSMSTVLAIILLGDTLTIGADVIGTTDIMLKGTVRFFAVLIDSLVISLVFYPILLCLQTKWKLLGNILGLLYSIVWLAFYIGSLATVSIQVAETFAALPDSHKFYMFLWFLANGFGIIFNSALVICFIVGLTKLFRKGIKSLAFKVDNDIPRMDFNETHFYHRVKFLLTPPMPQKTGGNIIVRLFRKYIGTVPGFRFSRRNICTFVLSIVVTIQMVLLLLTFYGGTLLWLKAIFSSMSGIELDEDINKMEIALWLTSIVAIFCTAVHLIDAQLRYRKHTLMLWKGDRSFAPQGKLKFSATLVASLRYSGYYVAFTVWGFVILQLVLWIILSCIILLWDQVLMLLKQYWLSLVVTLAFYYGQVYISRIVFLQMAPDPQQEARWICVQETTFGLDNRRVFHVTLYILMIANFIFGLLSCFVRIFKAVLFGTLYVGRLDRLVLMRDWELKDKGYTAYVGFLQLEVAHTHPVLVTFCHFLLMRTVKTDQAFGISRDELVSVVDAQVESGCDTLEAKKSRCNSPGGPTTRQLSRRMRNKWLVALTLSRNPQLVSERKGALIKQTQTVPSISDDVTERNRYYVNDTYAVA